MTFIYFFTLSKSKLVNHMLLIGLCIYFKINDIHNFSRCREFNFEDIKVLFFSMVLLSNLFVVVMHLIVIFLSMYKPDNVANNSFISISAINYVLWVVGGTNVTSTAEIKPNRPRQCDSEFQVSKNRIFHEGSMLVAIFRLY